VSGIVTFDEAPTPGTINLGIGQPSADLLPVDLLREASESFFSEAHPFELNYGVLAGDERFLESLAGYLGEGYDATVSAESLFVTGGSSQALDFVSTVFSTSGATVFVEEPSYFLAFWISYRRSSALRAPPCLWRNQAISWPFRSSATTG